MSKRKNFVLRIDPKTFRLIEKWADDEFRSVNGQLEWIIHKSLKDNKRLPKGADPAAGEETPGGKGGSGA